MPSEYIQLLLQRLLIGCMVLGMTACGTPRYTIDDGRPVDETLLGNIRLLGQGERLLRPAIVRSASLNDPDCSTQWELPFSVASSYELEETERVAWVRALQVDERLSVISTAPGCDLEVGEKLVELGGYSKKDSNKMLERLASLRDDGDPFEVKTSTGRQVVINPFKVCRGYTRLAPPNQPSKQDFHWLINTHPLDIFNPSITPDEALWMVLWGQGLSEQGGGRMKTFHYGKKFVTTLIDIASLAYGLNAAGQAAQAAANQALKTAGTAASKAASEAAARQLLEEAGKEAAQAAAKEYAQKIGTEIAKSVGKETAMVVGQSYVARVGLSVSSLSLVASTAFDDADIWAFERMTKLGADPFAIATLHRKLVDRGLVRNVFALDDERLGNLALKAKVFNNEEALIAAFRGVAAESLALNLNELLDASNDAAEASFLPSSTTIPASPTTATNSLHVAMPNASDND